MAAGDGATRKRVPGTSRFANPPYGQNPVTDISPAVWPYDRPHCPRLPQIRDRLRPLRGHEYQYHLLRYAVGVSAR